MSSPLALSAVTATLQTCLQLVYNSSALGTVSVSSVAPDLVQGQAGNQDAGLRVNLFLHQVTPNAAWRNVAQPSISADGSTRLKNPPLALDLHYLLTAYASVDTEAEALLGYAILMLHENPILPRSLITNVLNSLPTSQYNDAIKGSGLDNQIEMIKITPATLGREEMAWLWTALKADYRPTFPFQASVVLMRNELQTTFSLPVLSRNITVQPEVPAQPANAVASVVIAASPAPTAALVNSDTATRITLSGSTQINPWQQVYLLLQPPAGDWLVVKAESFSTPTTSLSFLIPSALTTGTFAARLEVDGVLTPTAQSWQFAPNAITVLP